MSLATIDRALEALRAGRPVLVLDAEDRENEGDVVLAAQTLTDAWLAWTIRHTSGYICAPVTAEVADRLDLPLMVRDNRDPFRTAYTVTVDAASGVTTGISAADRAHTISVAINHNRGRADIISPGHVFPLVAQDGGVLVRAGHTEAAVDVARLAGLNPSGVICEIMNDDGSMARMPDLTKFAEAHGLRIASISDLIAYRRRTERLVELVGETTLTSRFGGDFRTLVYANKVSYAEHLALVRGDVAGDEPVLVRMHQFNILADALGDISHTQFFSGEARPRGGELEASMRLIAKEDRGVIVIIREPTPTTLSRTIRERQGQAMKTPIAELRQYGIGAQILLDLGVRKMILLSNAQRNIVGLNGYGITLVGQQPIPGTPSEAAAKGA
jgi:3,4-dihydroxy 2-butanone 4-phosphate synthase / GTP cyclohydrolase II